MELNDAVPDPLRIALVCVQNAGRSQMAYAFAKQSVEARGLGDRVDLVTGGTDPAEAVHAGVIEAMRAVGFDLSERRPREVTFEEIQAADLVITMGCSADEVCPAGWAGEHRDWELADPAGQDPERVAEIRDEIEDRVELLIDRVAADFDASDCSHPD